MNIAIPCYQVLQYLWHIVHVYSRTTRFRRAPTLQVVQVGIGIGIGIDIGIGINIGRSAIDLRVSRYRRDEGKVHAKWNGCIVLSAVVERGSFSQLLNLNIERQLFLVVCFHTEQIQPFRSRQLVNWLRFQPND